MACAALPVLRHAAEGWYSPTALSLMPASNPAAGGSAIFFYMQAPCHVVTARQAPSAVVTDLPHVMLCSYLQLFGGPQNLMAVRNWVKSQIHQQCQGNIPRLKPDLPPQVCMLEVQVAVV